MRQSVLIHLSQIEQGTYLLEEVDKLKKLFSQFSEKHQYITNSGEIIVTPKPTDENVLYLTINPEYISELKQEIFDMILNEYNDQGEPKILGLVQNILKDIQDIKIDLRSHYQHIEDGLTEAQRLELEAYVKQYVSEQLYYDLNILETKLRKELDEKIELVKKELNSRIDETKEDINVVKSDVGNLKNLHEFLKEALNPNVTVKDGMNFLFQLIMDLNTNIIRVNDQLGTNKAPLVNSYVKPLPKNTLFNTLNNGDLIDRHNMLPDNSNVGNVNSRNDDLNFKSISDEIKYRKTFMHLNDNE